ncbi:MAG: methylenetetrahydrofolate--tRNA-(uracil(54)-C(5))-methyltransferase (FADH(2)-oxidizing) TrmFO [Chloroflexota bacterium]
MSKLTDITVIGGGLAGTEAAWQAAQRGKNVRLYEMRPAVETGAHVTGDLAELVCSNSLGSDITNRASGLLKAELRMMGSLLIELAELAAVPAGSALAVDRVVFAQLVTEKLSSHPNIEIIREEVTELPDTPTVIATGPLTSPTFADKIAKLSGESHLFFFDAISPIVSLESINMEVAFRASRYEKDSGEEQQGDYINCPMNQEEYALFVSELKSAERIEIRDFEQIMDEGVNAGVHTFFEGCLPVEVIAQRGEKSLAFGPMRPVGLTDPRTGRWPHAVLQLRQDDLAGEMYNLVGFQTNLKFSEQRRLFRMVPGLENAEFLRYGQMHRNTFIFSPRLLKPTLQFHQRDDLFFAGQLTGIEGYAGNIASGLLAGWNLSRLLDGQAPLILPRESMLGSLCYYITNASEKDFQPMKANFGIVPPLTDGKKRNKRTRAEAYAQRAMDCLAEFIEGADDAAKTIN